jgi:hypothetical protein
MRHLRAFGRFWLEFLVGDDWRIAAGVVTVLALGALAVEAELLSESVVAVLIALAIAAVVLVSVVGAGYADRNRREEQR